MTGVRGAGVFPPSGGRSEEYAEWLFCLARAEGTR